MVHKYEATNCPYTRVSEILIYNFIDITYVGLNVVLIPLSGKWLSWCWRHFIWWRRLSNSAFCPRNVFVSLINLKSDQSTDMLEFVIVVLMGCGVMDWIELAQDRDRWRAIVNTAMNRRVQWHAGNFLTSYKPASLPRRTLFHGVSEWVSEWVSK
jgi:hypothetical protein